MTPVTALSPALGPAAAVSSAGHLQADGRGRQGPFVEKPQDSQASTAASSTAASASVARPTPAPTRLHADLAAAVAEARAEGASPGEVAQRIEEVLAAHGVQLDRAPRLGLFHAYGKLLVQDQRGQVQLADPPEPGSVRHLLRTIEEVLHADDADMDTSLTSPITIGVDVRV